MPVSEEKGELWTLLVGMKGGITTIKSVWIYKKHQNQNYHIAQKSWEQTQRPSRSYLEKISELQLYCFITHSTEDTETVDSVGDC